MHKLKSNHIKLSQENRIYNASLPIIALTGGIATGKSTASEFFRNQGVPVIDADRLIKQIYAEDTTILFIESILPKVVVNGEIDFKSLREFFFNDESLKMKIEGFLYKTLPEQFTKELNKYKLQNTDFIIYDIPLLFEKDLKNQFDLDILIYCPKEVQIERLIHRDKITKKLARTILNQQMDIETKKSMAEMVVYNHKDLDFLNVQLKNTLAEITK